MTIVADTSMRRRLILIKQLYRRALVRDTVQRSTVDRLLAVVTFDLSIETALRGVLDSLNRQKGSSQSFQQLIDSADAAMRSNGLGDLPNKRRIREVHEIRNNAQHHMRFPDEIQLSDTRTHTRDILSDLFDIVWGIDFDTVSVVDLISCEDVREKFQRSEMESSSGHYDLAVKWAAIGLEEALNILRQEVVGPYLDFARPYLSNEHRGNDPSEESGKKVLVVLRRLQELVFYATLGMDLGDYDKFRELSGYASLGINGNMQHDTKEREWTIPEAEAAVAYFVDAVLEIESRIGSLEAPLGVESLYGQVQRMRRELNGSKATRSSGESDVGSS